MTVGEGEGPGERFGRWRLEALRGEGATARVWSARHVDLPRQAAVKVLRATFGEDPVARQRFAREAEVVARVRHPGPRAPPGGPAGARRGGLARDAP